MAILLASLLAWAAVAPLPISGPTGGALLLIGGALIGMPHGSSDFVVAHRLLQPRLRAWWLPAFLAAYLLVTAAVLLGWRFIPGATLAGFLVLSGLHFGAGDGAHGDRDGSASRTLARAVTPLLPIFLFHPGDVAGIVGLMCGRPAASVTALLVEVRPAGLALYGVLLGSVVLRAFGAPYHAAATSRRMEAGELLLLAGAAYALPPLVSFAIYFCGLHAVRHMAHLGHAHHPRDGRAALRLAALVVLPSALVCAVALGAAWDAVAGVLSTERLLAAALQLTASLTVPHTILEWWADREPT